MGRGRELESKKPIEQYDHAGKTRKNNPPVGLVTADTEKADSDKKTYAYDPHIDPRLDWAGKKEHTSFEVPTVSLHVHERIDPKTIIEAVRRKNGNGQMQLPLFESPKENPPLREALDFYKHSHNWSNRLIAGDSLLVMNSLIEKEGMAGQLQMIYIDPPYGIKYGSNFQPFVNKRDVKDGKDDDLTQEPETIRAFRDTWELGVHSYLTYLRDRLLLAKRLLAESGSCFVQISDENVQRVRLLMDEVFGAENFCSQIIFRKTTGKGSAMLDNTYDVLLWYARDKAQAQKRFRRMYFLRKRSDDDNYRFVEEQNGSRRTLKKQEWEQIDSLVDLKIFSANPLTSQSASSTTLFNYKFQGKVFSPGKGGWKTNLEGMKRLEAERRLMGIGNTLRFIRYYDDFPYQSFSDIWDDTRQSGFGEAKIYVVQTMARVVARCIQMTTDPGDLVFDPTCGSGTTAAAAEQWGRRWITCDTSRVAISLAKQRLMTTLYDYYELAHPEEGVGSGFKYKRVPHVTLKSIANSEPPTPETLYDQPLPNATRARITGPFTVEAVPSPVVKPLSEVQQEQAISDGSLSRAGATSRQADWRAELLQTGIRGKGKQSIDFSRIEPLPGTRWLHADGETKGSSPERVVVSFGPEHAPLEQKQVELAWEEARKLSPKPSMIVFASFHFDPEAAKDIDELTKDKTGMTFLKVQMNTDLLTEDLKKQRSSNQSFWLMGQPDVTVREIKKGEDKGKHQVEVHGFDYYNTKTGTIESGDTSKIAVWMLDTDYDGRSLYPRQVFFPIAGEKDGWARLAKNLKAEIDRDLIEAYRGTISLPFDLGKHKRVAVKIVDDRGIESLKVIEVA